MAAVDFSLTAGWGYVGQGEAVMQGQGRVVQLQPEGCSTSRTRRRASRGSWGWWGKGIAIPYALLSRGEKQCPRIVGSTTSGC